MSQISPETAQMISDLGTRSAGVVADASAAYGDAATARSSFQNAAILADAKAADAQNRAATEAAAMTAKGNKASATVQTQVANSGFTVGVGTAAAVEGTPAYIAALDAATIRENGRRESLGYQSEAGQDRARAKGISPWGNALGTAIGGAAKVAAYWAQKKYNPNSGKPQPSHGSYNDTGDMP